MKHTIEQINEVLESGNVLLCYTGQAIEYSPRTGFSKLGYYKGRRHLLLEKDDRMLFAIFDVNKIFIDVIKKMKPKNGYNITLSTFKYEKGQMRRINDGILILPADIIEARIDEFISLAEEKLIEQRLYLSTEEQQALGTVLLQEMV